MTFLFLLSLINLISLINFFFLLDLFLLLLALTNLISLLYLEEYSIYNNFTYLIVEMIRKFAQFLPYKTTIKFDKDENIFYIESKAFFWIIVKILFVLNSTIFIVISISLLPLFI